MKLTKKSHLQTNSVRLFSFKPVSLLLAASGIFALTLPSQAQDAFDSSGATGSMDSFSSSGATGSQTNNTGHFTGDEPSVIQGVNTAGMLPTLSGTTNGTVGPMGYYAESEELDAENLSDGPLSDRELEFAEILLSPVSCAEPVLPGVFPPMPQVPSLPEGYRRASLDYHQTQIDRKVAKGYFEKGKGFAKTGEYEKAAAQFTLALNCSASQAELHRRIAETFAKLAGKKTKNDSLEEKANLLRLAVFFDPSNSSNSASLDDCLKEQGKNPSDKALRSSLASQFENQNSFFLAAAEWEAVLKLDEASLSSHMKLAAALAATHSDREAQAELRRLVRMDWPDKLHVDQATCHRLLGEMFAQYMHAYHERGARATSLALLEAATMEARRAVTLNPLDAKASKLFITCSQDAVAYEPKVVDNHLLLGGAYLLKGDFRRCDQEYAFCEEIDKEDPRLAMARTIAHLISSNPSRSSKSTLTQAIKKVKELIDDDDENNQLWTLLGRLEKENSNDKEASAAFAKAKEIFWAPYRDNNKDD